MLTLIIETSTERGIVSIFRDDKEIFFAELPFGYNNSKFLLPQIDEALKKTDIKASDLTQIVVGIGPGSYTGIRVGVIIAKTMSYPFKLPLIGICSLQSFLPSTQSSFAVLIDAKIGGVYLTKGHFQNGKLHYTIAPNIFPLDKVAEELTDTEILVTPYKEILKPKIEAIYPNEKWEWQERGPSSTQMHRLALEKFANKEFTTECQLELLYLRKTQAEIEKDLFASKLTT